MSYAITRLILDHFRSWTYINIDFSPHINILVGRNGIGKTNLVESLEFLSTGSSSRVPAHRYLIERGYSTATIRAKYEDVVTQDSNQSTKKDNEEKYQEKYQEKAENTAPERIFNVTIPFKGAARVRINGGQSRYFSTIVGDVKVVSCSLDDRRFISADPAIRRKLIDTTAILIYPDYYMLLQKFQKIAKQRATLLKKLNQQQNIDINYLEAWTAQFIEIGAQITRYRIQAVEKLEPYFTRIAHDFSSGDENPLTKVSLIYEPSFAEVLESENPEKLISEHFQRIYPGEVARGANLIGPHRDDLTILLNGEPAKFYASSGEMWTLAIALKMAQFAIITDKARQENEKPVLILDDIFAQLDNKRRLKILDFAAKQGQVFITTASVDDIPYEIRQALLSTPPVTSDISSMSDSYKISDISSQDSSEGISSSSVDESLYPLFHKCKLINVEDFISCNLPAGITQNISNTEDNSFDPLEDSPQNLLAGVVGEYNSYDDGNTGSEEGVHSGDVGLV